MTLEEYIGKHRKNIEKSQSFVDYVYALMDAHGIGKSADIYNKVFISRQLWSSIMSGKSAPSLNVCIKIALGMRLDNHECKYLLKKAGYTLSSASKAALIVRYAIENGIYDIFEVNELLIKNGCEASALL